LKKGKKLMIRVADFYEYFAGLLRGYCIEKIVA